LFDIDYERYRGRYDLSEQEQNIEGVAHRIYYGFCVDGFMVNDDVFNYGTDIHNRPEFILNLVKLFPSLKSILYCGTMAKWFIGIKNDSFLYGVENYIGTINKSIESSSLFMINLL